MDAIDTATGLSTSTYATTTEPDGVQSAISGTPNGIGSSPPGQTLPENGAMDIDRSVENIDKSDSEAETIVLPGKDGHSPSKIRKAIKHEDRSDEEMLQKEDTDLKGNTEKRKGQNGLVTTSLKRKRPNSKDDAHLNSSSLSSVPTSPNATIRSSISKLAASNSDVSRSPSPQRHSATRDKAKSVDRTFPRRKQQASGSGDDDNSELRGFRKQGSGIPDHKAIKDGHSSKFDVENQSRKHARSTSPHQRSHRRSVSTQLPLKSSHGLSHKKKRVPPPLQSTEYNSDESSASASSHPRSSRVRSLAAPTTGDPTISPAKMAPHKKHVNSSGQTLLAQACGRAKLDVVKQRYEAFPEDLNHPDNALNTPLHTASLHGHADIVKFLLDTGNCELDSVNMVKDTPLHDAVDNRNIEVVKLLLDAGANPNKHNQAGNDVLDLVNIAKDDEEDEEVLEELEEIETLIKAAKKKFTEARRGSEDVLENEDGGRLSHSKESPRQTPPTVIQESLGSTNRRFGTARTLMKTTERVLYQRHDIESMRKAAREGDAEQVLTILNGNPSMDDPQTLYNAAKGGHDTVINLLFGIGAFDPDPPALEGVPADQPTPILAAIGKDNHLAVIDLFTGHARFDPTRRHRGETYYEVARRRAGHNWQVEEERLKKAFEEYQRTHKGSPSKPRSPVSRRDGRDAARDPKNSARKDEQATRTHKRSLSNPKLKEPESKHRSNSSVTLSKDGQSVPKRGPGRPRKEESAASDRENSPLGPPKQKSHSRKSESDVAVASENEPTAKPRRKLVSGKEFRGERELEKQRRASVASIASNSSFKEKRERSTADSKQDKADGRTSPNLSRISKPSNSAHGEREPTSEKQASDKERTRSLKRDDSKDRISAIRGESPVKRPRQSETPPRSGMQEVSSADYGSNGGPPKRRKVEGESKRGEARSSSPELRNTTSKSSLSRDPLAKKASLDNKGKVPRSVQRNSETPEASKDSSNSDRSSPNHPMKSSIPTTTSTVDIHAKRSKHSVDHSSQHSTDKTLSIVKLEEEETARQALLKRERKEKEAFRQKEAEEEKEKEKAEQARLARLAREQAAREDEERREREEAARKERQRIEDAEAQSRAMEEQRARYIEQERIKREEQERRRAQLLETQRAERLRVEKEKQAERLAKLPLLLKMFDQTIEPKTTELANLFKKINGYRYDTIRPEASGQPGAEEQWMLNTHAAILLGEKDLQLSRCKLSISHGKS